MADPQRDVSECTRYLDSSGPCPWLRQAFPLLIKEFSPKIVEQALEQLPTGASPGLDGVPAGVYQLFPKIFSPRIFASMSTFLATGEVPRDWGRAAIRPVPKAPGLVSVKDQRPIC